MAARARRLGLSQDHENQLLVCNDLQIESGFLHLGKQLALVDLAQDRPALPRRLPEAASKYPLQPLATRKALHLLRPRSDPESFLREIGGSRQGGHRLFGWAWGLTMVRYGNALTRWRAIVYQRRGQEAYAFPSSSL